MAKEGRQFTWATQRIAELEQELERARRRYKVRQAAARTAWDIPAHLAAAGHAERFSAPTSKQQRVLRVQDLKAQMARDKADVEAFLGQQSTQAAVRDKEADSARVSLFCGPAAPVPQLSLRPALCVCMHTAAAARLRPQPPVGPAARRPAA